MNIYKCLIGAALGLSIGCDPGLPGDSSQFQATGFAAPLSQTEFNNLPPVQQYEVANKLYASMLRGINVEDFFDMSAGMANLTPAAGANTFLDDTHTALLTHASRVEIHAADTLIDGLDDQDNPDTDNAVYLFDGERPRQIPLARIHEYPISRDFFVNWMAYFLTNTIMFSPAYEMETTDITDVQAVYRFLVAQLADGRSVREIIRSHLPRLQRWRVSRSAENHALEAYELYLGLFETEEDSIRGGIACRDLYLTPENEGYQIAVTDYPNTEPQLILDSHFIVTCDDLYDVIAGHELLMPRVTEVILNYLMSGRSQEDRLAMIQSIVGSNPRTFEDIFTAILFSREYLLNTQRPKSYEENIMSLLDTLRWDARIRSGESTGNRIFNFMASGSNNANNDRLYLGNKGWDTMSLKIGRLPDVPLDSLSFGNYHKAIREQLLIFSDGRRYGGEPFSGSPVQGLFYDTTVGAGNISDRRSAIDNMPLGDMIDYLFLNSLQRTASDVEKTDLTVVIEAEGYTSVNADGITIINPSQYSRVGALVLDYVSRLPEFYYFRAIN